MNDFRVLERVRRIDRVFVVVFGGFSVYDFCSFVKYVFIFV